MSLAEPDQTAHPAGSSPSRSRKAPDYRLRGLDLGAHPVAPAAPSRPVRNKDHPRRPRRRRLLIQWAVLLAVAAIVALLLRGSVVEPFSVPTASMVPTLQAGNRILVVKTRFLTGPVKLGQIIVLHPPNAHSCSTGGDQSHEVVKRVIGLPGQTIWSDKETIYVDGRILQEPGWYNPPFGQLGSTEIPVTKIPAGSYFVMGDNRTDTCDSREFGPVPKSLVVGRVVATILRDGHPYVHFH